MFSVPAFDAGKFPEHVQGCDIGSVKRTVLPGDCLFSKLNPRINRVWVIPAPAKGIQVASPEFWPLRLKKNREVSPEYLCHFLSWEKFRETVVGREEAATKSRSRLKPSQLLSQSIPVPPLAEQIRIVAILDVAEELRRFREQADRRTADLIPALFHEMFGDEQAFEKKCLGDILSSIDSGWSPVCHEEPATNEEWGVLKLGAVTTGYYLDTENKALPEVFTPRPGIEVKKGDILFTRKNTKDLVAAIAYVWHTRSKLMLSDLIFRLRLQENVGVEPLYLTYALKNPLKRREIQSLASGTAGSMPNISKQRLIGVMVLFPSIDLQKVFVARVAKIRVMEEQQAESCRRLNDLYQSLLHRAFRGDL